MSIYKYLLASLVSISICLASFLLASAAITPGQVPGASDLNINPSPVKDVPQMVQILAQVVHWIYIVFFIVTVLFILFAAYSYLTSRGDPETIKTAHKRIFWAAIAIVIALMAVGAEVIVKDFLTNYNVVNNQGNPPASDTNITPVSPSFPAAPGNYSVPGVYFQPSTTKR